MLSWRLWQTLAEPSIRNPIFAFVRDKRVTQLESQPRSIRFRLGLGLILAVFLFIAFLTVPEFVLLLFQIPILFIVMVIVSPLFLPLMFTIFGGILVHKITRAIYQEKYQFTYELLCASPNGSLIANWSFAKGLLHRHEAFVWLKSMTQLCFTVGKFVIAGSGILIIYSLIMQGDADRLEQVRLMINLTIILGLFYSSMHQSVVVSIIIGLYTSTLDINRYDSRLIALLGYIFAQFMPVLFALFLYYLTTTIHLPHLIISIGFDALILMSIYIVRELIISILWVRLKYRLNATTDTTQSMQSEANQYVSIFGTS